MQDQVQPQSIPREDDIRPGSITQPPPLPEQQAIASSSHEHPTAKATTKFTFEIAEQNKSIE